MTFRHSSVPQRFVLSLPPASSLLDVPDPESDLARVASPSDTRCLATLVSDPTFEFAVASALVTELVDFASTCHLDYFASLVSKSDCPPFVGGELALGCDVLEDRLFQLECLGAAVPHLVAMMLALEGDPDALDIPSPCSYALAIMAPPPWANIVDGMWIFRVKRLLGSPHAFKACFVAQGFNQRKGFDFFHTFSITPKMTTLRVLLHVATQSNYEQHSLDFSIAFLQGSLHEKIWLRRPLGFMGSFLEGTQWSLRRPVYGLRQALREWHDTLRMTLAALGFAPSTSDPSLFLRTGPSLTPFYILVYVDELQVLQHFRFQLSLPQSTPLPTSHSLPAPPSDESVEPSGPYPELVSCLMYLTTCTWTDLAHPLSILACYVAPGRHQPEHWRADKRVLRYLCNTWGMGLVLGGRGPFVLTGHSDASSADDQETQQSSHGYTFSLGTGSLSSRSSRSSSVLSSSFEAEIYAGAMAAQELRWLTYLLSDLVERPCSPPVVYVNNKATIALCWEQRLEHKTKHIALCYFLARELQQHGQLRLAYVASQANTADIFTKGIRFAFSRPPAYACHPLFHCHSTASRLHATRFTASLATAESSATEETAYVFAAGWRKRGKGGKKGGKGGGGGGGGGTGASEGGGSGGGAGPRSTTSGGAGTGVWRGYSISSHNSHNSFVHSRRSGRGSSRPCIGDLSSSGGTVVWGLSAASWGHPTSVAGPSGERFFLVVDEFSHYTTVFPLQQRAHVPNTLILWLLATSAQCALSVLYLYFNCGGEFRSRVLAELCCDQGITKSIILPGSPQQNGVAERRIGLVMEIARTSIRFHRFISGLGHLVSFVFGAALHMSTILVQTSSQLAPSGVRDVTFDESVSFYTGYPQRGRPVPPPPLFLVPTPPPSRAPPVLPPHRGAGLGGAGFRGSDVRAAGGVGAGGAGAGGAGARGAKARGIGTGGAGSNGAGYGGTALEVLILGVLELEVLVLGVTLCLHVSTVTRYLLLTRLRLSLLLGHCCLLRCLLLCLVSLPPRVLVVTLILVPRLLSLTFTPCSVMLFLIMSHFFSPSLIVCSQSLSDYFRTARPVVSRVLSSLVTDPTASPSSVSAPIVRLGSCRRCH
ncbi:unnamed protein product [Closterium sp. NIES-54]